MARVSKIRIEDVSMMELDPPQDVDRMEINSEEVQVLADSIKELGLLQGIMVRPVGDRYEVVLGHRRYLAHLKLGRTTIRAEIKKLDDIEAALIRATENLARVDLTPLEEARIYRNLYEKHGMPFDAIGKRMGRKPATIKHRMDILRMPDILQNAIHHKKISMSVAEELWVISDLPALEYYLNFALDNGCTKTVARSWAKEWKDSKRRDEAAKGLDADCLSPYEPKPIYISCDLCDGPVELGKDKQLRLCENCWLTIKQNM